LNLENIVLLRPLKLWFFEQHDEEVPGGDFDTKVGCAISLKTNDNTEKVGASEKHVRPSLVTKNFKCYLMRMIRIITGATQNKSFRQILLI